MNLSCVPRVNGAAIVLAFAALSFSWQLWGIRYENHDDILFNLYSRSFANSSLELARHYAHVQARIQAYVNIPLFVWIDGLYESAFYDVLNIGSILACYGGLIYLLNTISPGRGATSVVSLTLLLFPLHYYFSFPQGYPVMACWGLCFAFVSAGLLGSTIRRPSWHKRVVSICLFFLSLWGSEYNFVLHPVLICASFLNAQLPRGRELLKIAVPYVVALIGSLASYWVYSVVMHNAGADPVGRTVPKFAFVDWLKTFLIMEEKAFLPASLWTGIHLVVASGQGVPDIPPTLSFSSIAPALTDWTSLAVIFVSAWICAFVAVRSIQVRQRTLWAWALVFLSLQIIPCAVVAASAHYQHVIQARYIQGHLSTFYAQLGAAGLSVLLLSALCSSLRHGRRRKVAWILCSLVLSTVATVTFVYNNINRQVMNANMQKWQAMRELVQFVQFVRPDLASRTFNAHAFWTFSGVSTMPRSEDPFIVDNYWSDYSRSILGFALSFRDSEESAPDTVEAMYFATPTGIPVAALYEQGPGDGAATVSLVASRPVKGTLVYRFTDGTLAKENAEHWVCREHCTQQWTYDRPIESRSITFCPTDAGPASLLMQLLARRGGDYGLPAGQPQNEVCARLTAPSV